MSAMDSIRGEESGGHKNPSDPRNPPADTSVCPIPTPGSCPLCHPTPALACPLCEGSGQFPALDASRWWVYLTTNHQAGEEALDPLTPATTRALEAIGSIAHRHPGSLALEVGLGYADGTPAHWVRSEVGVHACPALARELWELEGVGSVVLED